MLTDHATRRAKQRADITDVVLMEQLWSQGRPAAESDYLAFCSWPREGVLYRIVIRSRQTLMLARGANGDFVTVLLK